MNFDLEREFKELSLFVREQHVEHLKFKRLMLERSNAGDRQLSLAIDLIIAGIFGLVAIHLMDARWWIELGVFLLVSLPGPIVWYSFKTSKRRSNSVSEGDEE